MIVRTQKIVRKIYIRYLYHLKLARKRVTLVHEAGNSYIYIYIYVCMYVYIKFVSTFNTMSPMRKKVCRNYQPADISTYVLGTLTNSKGKNCKWITLKN